MKTIKNIIEYINESKIVNSFKNLFSKLKTFFQGEDNFDNKVHLSTKLFGELKRLQSNSQVKEHNITILQHILEDDVFEIWCLYNTENKYGDKVRRLKLFGIYDGENEELFYHESLKDYIDKKYFEE